MTHQEKIKHRLNAIFYHTRKWVWFVSLALSIFLVVSFGIAQYWLPTLLSDKQKVEQYLSNISKQTITVGQIHTSWDGVYPGIRATNIEIRDPSSKTGSMNLKEVRISLSYLSALKGQAILHRLVLVEPNLEVTRNRTGRIQVSGLRNEHRKSPVSATDRSGANAVAVNWLLSQGWIEIQNGSLVWNDLTGARPEPMRLDDVNLVLQNDGSRHRMDFSADFPEEICATCSFAIDIEGNPLSSSDWGGFVDINAIGLTLKNRLTRLSTKYPVGLNGKVDMVLRSQWAQGQPRLAFGRVTANNIDVPLGKFGKSLTVNELVATLKWRSRKKTWSMDMDLPYVRINNEAWLPGSMKVSRYVGGTSLYVKHLDIRKVLSVAERFSVPEKPREFLAKLQPAGSVDEIYVDLKDKQEDGADGEDRLNVKAELRGIHTSPYKRIPGFKGLSATVNTTETGGEVFLNSKNSVFNSTHVFRKPIPIHRARARLTWQKANNIIEVNTQNIQLVGRDLSLRGGFIFHFPLDRSQSPQLDLRASIFNGIVARKSVYLPVNVMKPSLVEWLDKSIISGKLTDGHVIYRGKVREFPFVHDNGLFEVVANVEHGKLQYLPGWTPISGANMKLLFRGQSMVITSSAGKVDQLNINEIVAAKDNLKNKQEPVRITGRVTGPVNNTLAVLRKAVANGQRGKWTRFVESDIRANGLGQLSLGIEIPAKAGASHRLNGRYEFLGTNMVLPIGDIPTRNMRGAIRFDEKRVVDGKIRASALGGPIQAEVFGGTSRREPDTLFRLSGKMSTTGLSKEYGGWIREYFTGSIPWKGEVGFKDGVAKVSLNGDIKAVATGLPAPVKQLSRQDENLLLYTTSSSQKRHVLRFEVGDRLNGLLDYQARGAGWKFVEGVMMVGRGQALLQGNNGLFMSFNGGRVNGEAWADVIYDTSGDGGIPLLVQGVSGTFDELEFLGREWGRAEFSLRRPDRYRWSGDLTGQSIAGKVSLDTEVRGGKIALNLDRLHIPGKREEKDKDKKSGPDEKKLDPRRFPTLAITSSAFSFGPMNLGKLNFSAERTRIGWEIARLQLTRPDLSVFADGTWFNVAGKHITKGKMRVTSSDLGESMTALGSPDQVTGGKLNMDLNFNWRQDRKHPGLANLNGEVSIHAEDGQFNKLRADGGGGPFSIFALSRYLSLDFSPALGKGFAFNDIKGKITVQQGDARTDGFTLSAPAAAVVARGHVGLHKRDIDVHADIYPNLKGGVTVATGSLFGLQAAAWAYALQQLFSSEIEKGTRISYHISGNLDKPKVTKVVSQIERKKK